MINAPTVQAGALLGVVDNQHQCSNPAGHNTPLKWDGSPETLPTNQWLPTAARRYAQLGFKVGPLNGKVPLTPNGFKDFTTDLAQVQAWWEKWPGANIGATPPKGMVVLDIDPRNGGWDTWVELGGLEVPDTLMMLTGSHGLHYWFTLPYSGDVRGTAGEGVDVKTHTGYVVVPPSVHPTTGMHYLIAHWCTPVVLPTWLRAHVYKPLPKPVQARRVQLGESPGAGLVATVEQAGEGQRNNVLHWAACRALEDGLDLTAELTTAAQSIGLSDMEIQRTLASAANTVGRAA
ncbi:bifunctional DNA primase/polymerase domain protein [Corynebacterium efficiens YS-314]|nr:bifunctional DNA primase/polymerase [Corynebacterium efficiens]EEW49124.1 bifunctional DNA primase/polymerase domain protein [Corynebacterium efficiens YS-314]